MKKVGFVSMCLLMLAAMLSATAYAQQFSEWSAPVNLGPVVNSPYAEAGMAISKDGLSLYLTSNRPGGFGAADLYVSTRPTVNDPWGPPVNLGSNVNGAANDQAPFVSTDGHTLYFHSDRPGGFGGRDLYVSRRHNKRDDLGWQAAVNLGPNVNTAYSDARPFVFEDDATGVVSLYFDSDRPGVGMDDIYVSTLQPDESFGPPVLVEELNTPLAESAPFIGRDGLEFYFTGSQVDPHFGDIWVSTRADTSQPWSPPVSLGPVVNAERNDSNPRVSFEGTELYFSSGGRPGSVGGLDLYMSTRTKLKSPDEE